MVNPYPKTVVINLVTSTKRREQISAHLEALNLKAEFFPAIDGRQLSTEEIGQIYDETRAETTHWGKLTPGEIGCALSHRAIWQALIDSGDKGWIVLEDDAVLAKDVPEWIPSLTEITKDGEVVLFVDSNSTPYYFGRTRLGSRWLIYANQAFYNATAYYITPLAAHRLLEASKILWFPIDFWYSSPGFKGVTPVKLIWPGAAHQREEESIIGHREALVRHSRSPKKQKNWIRRKIGIVRRYIKNRFLMAPVRKK